jgi:putative PIN family toxin of toxin-antitoxin system
MSRSRRVVIDTSTLVSAALCTSSIPDQALSRAVESFDVCSSIETLAELERVLSRGKFERYRSRESLSAFVAKLQRRFQFFAISPDDLSAVDPPCRDPKDNQFLALTLVAGADVLISSDED